MIRKPIRLHTRIGLGILSFVVLIALYAGMSIWQHQLNPKNKTFPNLRQFGEGMSLLTSNTERTLLRHWPSDPSQRTPGVSVAAYLREYSSHTEDSSAEKTAKVDTNEDGEVNSSDVLTFLSDIKIIRDTFASLVRLGLGLLAGASLAFVLGVTMACFNLIEAIFLPVISFFAKIPPTAMMCVFFVLVGIDLTCFIAVIAFGILPTLTQAIHQAAKKDVTEHAIYKAYTLGASQFEVIWEVVIRQILPRIIENIRLQVGPAMVFMIAAEMLIAQEGLGYQIRQAQKRTDMSVVYIYLILLGVAGFLIDWALSSLRRRLCPWFGE
jgi:NitT/TauT family transport system permease protein